MAVEANLRQGMVELTERTVRGAKAGWQAARRMSKRAWFWLTTSADRARKVRRIAALLAAALFLLSLALPYWNIVLHAPQYPGGLEVTAFINRLTGDVDEVNSLNHYIGMMRLEDAATLERTYAYHAAGFIVLLLLMSAALRRRGAWLLSLPMIGFPAGFIADLSAWLYFAGHTLDPNAALSNSIKPFTPTVFGEGIIGQFRTVASFEAGFWLALSAALVAAFGVVVERRSRTLQKESADAKARGRGGDSRLGEEFLT